MTSPYESPKADLGPPGRRVRVAHSRVAFASAVLVPVAVASIVRGGVGAPIAQHELVGALGIGAFGGVLAAGAVFRHQRMPLWGAALAGIGVVLLLLVMPSVMERVMRP